MMCLCVLTNVSLNDKVVQSAICRNEIGHYVQLKKLT